MQIDEYVEFCAARVKQAREQNEMAEVARLLRVLAVTASDKAGEIERILVSEETRARAS